MPLPVWRHSLSLEWAVGGRAWVLVSVGVNPSFSDGLACRPCNPLADSSPWEGGIHYWDVLKMHQLAGHPHPGPSHSMESSQGAASACCIRWPHCCEKEPRIWAPLAEVRGVFLLVRIWPGAQPCRPGQKMGWDVLATLPLPCSSPGGGRALLREGKALNKARMTCWAHLSISQGGDNKEKGWNLQLAVISGRSGSYKNPRFVEFTAMGCWAKDPKALSLSFLSYKMGINNNSTYLLKCFVGIKWLNVSKIFRIVPGPKYIHVCCSYYDIIVNLLYVIYVLYCIL